MMCTSLTFGSTLSLLVLRCTANTTPRGHSLQCCSPLHSVDQQDLTAQLSSYLNVTGYTPFEVVLTSYTSSLYYTDFSFTNPAGPAPF